jgi:beta-phosphoglucomutase family hydrolase
MALKIQIPTADYAGYIFDLDGTLVDTMPLHYQAWDQAIRAVGLQEPLSEDLFYSLGGVPTRKVAELIGKHYGLPLDPEAVFHHKEAIFLDHMPKVGLIAPVADFARKMAGVKPVAIASGGDRKVVTSTLAHANLTALFPVVVTADDVIHGKPSPDMFLLAAKRMGVEPTKCLVFEDAEPGIQAARAAGMDVVRVPSRPERNSSGAVVA